MSAGMRYTRDDGSRDWHGFFSERLVAYDVIRRGIRSALKGADMPASDEDVERVVDVYQRDELLIAINHFSRQLTNVADAYNAWVAEMRRTNDIATAGYKETQPLRDLQQKLLEQMKSELGDEEEWKGDA